MGVGVGGNVPQSKKPLFLFVLQSSKISKDTKMVIQMLANI